MRKLTVCCFGRSSLFWFHSNPLPRTAWMQELTRWWGYGSAKSGWPFLSVSSVSIISKTKLCPSLYKSLTKPLASGQINGKYLAFSCSVFICADFFANNIWTVFYKYIKFKGRFLHGLPSKVTNQDCWPEDCSQEAATLLNDVWWHSFHICKIYSCKQFHKVHWPHPCGQSLQARVSICPQPHPKFAKRPVCRSLVKELNLKTDASKGSKPKQPKGGKTAKAKTPKTGKGGKTPKSRAATSRSKPPKGAPKSKSSKGKKGKGKAKTAEPEGSEPAAPAAPQTRKRVKSSA